MSGYDSESLGIKDIIAYHKVPDKFSIHLNETKVRFFSIDTPVQCIVDWYLQTEGKGDLKILIPK